MGNCCVNVPVEEVKPSVYIRIPVAPSEPPSYDYRQPSTIRYFRNDTLGTIIEEIS